MIIFEKLKQLGSDLWSHLSNKFFIKSRILGKSLNWKVNAFKGSIFKEGCQLVKDFLKPLVAIDLQVFLDLARVLVDAPYCH